MRDSVVGILLQTICLRHDVLAEGNTDLELNLLLLAGKTFLAYHDGALQCF